MISVKATDRDLRVLIDIYQHTFLSFYQIWKYHFKNCAKATVYNRLAKLVKGELIESIRVNLKVIHFARKDIGVIYTLTKKGFNLINRYFTSKVFRDALPPINFNQLYHDLVLTDVLKVLETSLDCHKTVDSKMIKAEFKSGSQIPDGVIFFKDKKYALEVELTAKSNMRYRDIVYNYSTSLDFEKVLYLVCSDAVRSKIGNIIMGTQSSYQKSDDTGKFYFCNIQDFFRNNHYFKFDNGGDKFCSGSNLKYNNRSMVNDI